jgi:hypothetical protein
MQKTLQFYQDHGVCEYDIYDPNSGVLSGWLRESDQLRRIPEMKGFVSPQLGIRIEPGKGPDNLRIIRPDGRPLLT